MNPLFVFRDKRSFEVYSNDTSFEAIFVNPLFDNLKSLLAIFKWGRNHRWQKSGRSMLLTHLIQSFESLHRNIFIKLFSSAAIHLQVKHATTYYIFGAHVFNLTNISSSLLKRLKSSLLFHAYYLFDCLILNNQHMILKKSRSIEDILSSEKSKVLLVRSGNICWLVRTAWSTLYIWFNHANSCRLHSILFK